MNKNKGFTPLEIFKALRINCKILSKLDISTKIKKMSQRFLTGFTLIELMLVVIIIGILVSMVVPRLAGRSEEARIAAARADIKANISLALDLYELDNGTYPTTLLDLIQEPESKPPNWKGRYLKKKPIDPWGREYKYKSPGDHNEDYDLYSCGPDGVEGGGDDITNWEEERQE